MKKIVLTMVALMSMTMTFAENETAANLNKAEAYNMKTGASADGRKGHQEGLGLDGLHPEQGSVS